MNIFDDERQKEEMQIIQRMNCQFQAKEGFVLTGAHLQEEFDTFPDERFRIKDTDKGIKNYVYKNKNIYGVDIDDEYIIVYRVSTYKDIYTIYGSKVYYADEYVMVNLNQELTEIKKRMDEDINNIRNWIYLQSTIIGGLLMDTDDIDIDTFGILFKTFTTIATEEDFIPDIDTINNLLLDIRDKLEEKHHIVVDNLLSDLNTLR